MSDEMDNLDFLTDPFTSQEIDAVVANLPSEKSPSPDGFNTDFYQEMLAHYQARLLQLIMC
jgi:hypothetical protein